MILLEMKIPQLSKPEATAARNQNSIGDRMEKNVFCEHREKKITHMEQLQVIVHPHMKIL